MKYTFILLSIVITLLGCKNQQSSSSSSKDSAQTTKDVELTVDEPRDSTSILPIAVSEKFRMNETGDSYHILTAKIVDQVLWLTVSYGGGCREHEFEMRFNNAYQERLDEENQSVSLITLSLHHSANQDVCRSIVTQNLRFSLEALNNSGYENLLIRLSHFDDELNYSQNQ